MTSEQLQIIVEWMEYEWIDYLHIRDIKKKSWVVDGNEWNPDTDRNCWPKIWEMLIKKMIMGEYLHCIRELNPDERKASPEFWWHTTPLEICCKALLEVIKGQ